MDWFSLVSSTVLFWVFSLCIGLGVLQKTPTCSLMSGVAGKRNILLVVAHPDDESMFFSPTILYLASSGHDIHILCLSTGNADGKGNIRKEELYNACSVLKVPVQHIKVLDHPDLQDGFGEVWSHQLIVKIVEDEILSRNVNMLITFDKYGISGHPNHCDVHRSICMLLRDEARSIEAWELVSTNILRKYSGPVDIWLSFFGAHHHRQQMCCLVNSLPHRSFCAMAEHASQWIWFRKLFVAFSSYTYINTLRKICV